MSAPVPLPVTRKLDTRVVAHGELVAVVVPVRAPGLAPTCPINRSPRARMACGYVLNHSLR